MNRPLSTTELDQVTAAITAPAMTKREKLLRFAKIVRESEHRFVIFSNIEYMHPLELHIFNHPGSAFAAAAADNILHDAGLNSGSVGEAMRFFELSRDDLHAFSCDCGGAISNDEMARRIEALARGAT